MLKFWRVVWGVVWCGVWGVVWCGVVWYGVGGYAWLRVLSVGVKATPDNFKTTKRAPGSGTVARAVEVTGCIQ